MNVINEKEKTILTLDRFKFGFQKNLANDITRWIYTQNYYIHRLIT